MTTLHIAAKDLLRSMRSVAFLAFGFVIPLLASSLFYFAFAGMSGSEQGFDLPLTTLQVANLDQPDPRAGGLSLGDELVRLLGSPEASAFLALVPAQDADGARAAVDRQEASAALIVPPGFTSAALEPQGRASIELYHDPTLVLGPGVVAGMVRQVVDAFSGAKIAGTVAVEQLPASAAGAAPAVAQAVAVEYAHWAAGSGSQGAGGTATIAVRAPSTGEQRPRDMRVMIVSQVMAGMLVFYLFFTGAATTQTLLQEEEGGTLARLFTTPVRTSAILGGRLIATYATLIVQAVVLLAVSGGAFGIDWGPLPGLAAVSAAVIVLSAGFGLFVTSLLRSTRQGGLVYGGLLTVLGMIGMISTFTVGAPPASREAFGIASRLVPQGWGVHGLQILLDGGGLVDVLPAVAVMLGLGALFFGAGLVRFRRRFA